MDDVVLAVVDDAEGEVGVVEGCALDVFGCLFDDGECLVDFAEANGGKVVDFLNVGFYIAVGTLSIWDQWGDKFVVASLAEIKRFLAIWVGLDSLEGVVDNRV